MVIQERYDRMDWVTYGNEQMRKGEKKGEKKGEQKMADLVGALIADGKDDEIGRATSDKEYRESLYKKYAIGEDQ